MPDAGHSARISHPFVTAAALDQLLALLGEAVAVVGADGRIAYCSPGAARLLRGRQGHALLADVIATATHALAGDDAAPDGGTAPNGCYRVARLIDTAADGPLAVVVLARPPADLPAGEELMWRFGLTAREASVARLLAEGHDNASVADALGIRGTTARHYTETVLLKLGVRSRAAVAAALLGAPHDHGRPGFPAGLDDLPRDPAPGRPARAPTVAVGG